MPTKQEELDAILLKTAQAYEGLNVGLQDYAIQEVRRSLDGLTDLLLQYSNKGDEINKARIASLINDLQAIEQSIYQNGMNAMGEVVKQSAETSIGGSGLALATAVGVTAEVTDDVFNRLSMETVRYVVNRFGEDGLVLSDRVWQLAKGQRAELEQVIRNGIIRGESVNTLVAKVRKVYANETWKIRRLVITEGNVAYRTAGAYVAQQSKFVKGLRIHRGEADRPEHRCSQLEKIDRYGMGAGVFKPDDNEVLSPHVNCTSFTTFELIDDDKVQETKQKVKADKKVAEPYVDPIFRNEGLEMKMDKTPSGKPVLMVHGQPLTLGQLNEEGINQIKHLTTLKDRKAFTAYWQKLEDDGQLTEKLNYYFRKVDDMYTTKDTLFSVPNYKVGFGRFPTEALGKKAFGWSNELDEDERDAIASYTGSTSTAINKFWRKAETDNDDAEEKSKYLDSAISKGVLKDNVMLYRGAGYDAIGGALALPILQGRKHEVIGATVQDLGYMSTSLGATSKFDKEVTFQIMAKKGTKGMYVEEFTSTMGEQEVLLARGTKLKIVDVNTFGSKIHLLVEVID
jgi:hypothetical protein